MMERGELVSSAASGSDGSTQTENDYTLSEGCSESEDTLNLVEGAILRTLKRYSAQQQHHDHGSNPGRRSEKLGSRGRFNNVGDDEEHGSSGSVNAPPARSSNPDDMELLANLLEEVHNLRRDQRQGSRRLKETVPAEVQDTLKHSHRRHGKEKISSSEELRVTLEAATMAAKAAADAAEAAAVSVARNTEAIDFLVNSMKSSKKRHKAKRATASDEKKAILRSNRVTHWILGFMAVTTIAWRFGVVKVAKGVRSKLSDPLGYVGNLIGGNDEQTSEEKPVEKSETKGNLLDKLSHVELPSLLPDHKDNSTNSAVETKGNEAKSFLTKSAAAVDVKTKDAGKEAEKTAFSFANLFQVKPKEN